MSVVEGLDVFEDLVRCFRAVQTQLLDLAFGLQRREQRLDKGVVVAIALRTHATEHLIVAQQLPVCIRGISAATVTVMHLKAPMHLNSIIHSLEHYSGIMVLAHGPTDNLTIEQVQHYCQIKPTFHY